MINIYATKIYILEQNVKNSYNKLKNKAVLWERLYIFVLLLFNYLSGDNHP